MSIADTQQRSEALDTQSSFCVTAPAGSGKTELLIQRYLGLLARVERPEQVLAITFTRKAAAEMRERVLQALAACNSGREPADHHEKVTRKLAEAALKRDAALNWQLQRDISRLNIKTIDSFCASLTRQMPVLSQFGGQARTVDAAGHLYEEAVAELFGLLDSEHKVVPDLKTLLLHFDNNWDQVGSLLGAMLARRDQWYDYMGTDHGRPEAEAALLATVDAVVREALSEVAARLQPHRRRLLDLLCYSLNNLGEPVPDVFPAAEVDDLAAWLLLRRMLLTNQGTWRRRVDKNIGFLAGKGMPTERKEELLQLLSELAEIPGLEPDLDALGWLPETGGHARSWQLVLHLSRLLPVLAACLLVVFRRRGEVDHSQVALSALEALGEDSEPTELALRLDYRIEHILVDEFQDTAIGQYRLVNKLTRGWGEFNAENPERPRTVFIVGDGMQSIYGFRDANVGLFLKAREEGFNGVVPRALALQCNFRSDAGIVNWVNDAFSRAFPPEDNVRRGQVSFTPAAAVREAVHDSAVSCHAFVGEANAAGEASFVAEEIRLALADKRVATIAILGRSRAQLAPVLASLRQAGIPYAAQDMDALAGAPAVVDLMTLCRALANPADRVAAFALLRAPWLGLPLADLQQLAELGEQPQYTSLTALLAAREQVLLSSGGARVVDHLAAVWDWAWSRRDRLDLRVWIEQAWLQLDGPATVGELGELADAKRFFELLQAAQVDGVGLDIAWLEQRLARLYAAGVQPDARVQVMTLHKAKGLEFDWVFVPALGKSTRGDGRDLLLWDEYNGPDGQRGFLLAADDHSGDKEPSLYNYLKRTRSRKSRLETTRLLYVGATRAVQRLVLTTTLSGDADDEGQVVEYKSPGEGSLLTSLWPVFEAQMELHGVAPSANRGGTTASPKLLRLVQQEALPVVPTIGEAAGPNMPARVLNRTDRFVGTVVHLALEELAGETPLPETIKPDARERWRVALSELGLVGSALSGALLRVEKAVVSTLEDTDVGHWVLDAAHPESACELELTWVDDSGAIRDIVIDRTFVDKDTGERWIIDYKTSAPREGESPADFMSREAGHYCEQLSIYRDCLAGSWQQPLRCALYFTTLGRLHELAELALPGTTERT